jgi:hypothetical protein
VGFSGPESLSSWNSISIDYLSMFVKYSNYLINGCWAYIHSDRLMLILRSLKLGVPKGDYQEELPSP